MGSAAAELLDAVNIKGKQEMHSWDFAHEKALTLQGPLIQTGLTPSFIRHLVESIGTAN